MHLLRLLFPYKCDITNTTTSIITAATNTTTTTTDANSRKNIKKLVFFQFACVNGVLTTKNVLPHLSVVNV